MAKKTIIYINAEIQYVLDDAKVPELLKWLEENGQKGAKEPLSDGSIIVQNIDISCSD